MAETFNVVVEIPRGSKNKATTGLVLTPPKRKSLPRVSVSRTKASDSIPNRRRETSPEASRLFGSTCIA